MSQSQSSTADSEDISARERLAALRWRFFRNASDMLHSESGAAYLLNPAVLFSGSALVRQQRLNGVLRELSAVPEGEALVDAAQGHAEMSFEMNLKGSGLHRSGREVVMDGKKVLQPEQVVVNGMSTRGMAVAVLAHELEHQRQGNAGVAYPDQGKVVPPQDRVWHNRTIEADAEATAVETAWKLRAAGKPAAWHYLKYASQHEPSPAEVYEKQARADPAAVADGRAKRAAFDAWFSSKDQYGRTLSQAYNEAVLSKMMPTSDELRRAMQTIFPPGRLNLRDLEMLGSISDVNYLKLPGARPLDDPFYRQQDMTPDQARRLAAYEAEYAVVARDFAAKGPAAPQVPPKSPVQQKSQSGFYDPTLYAPGYRERMAAASAALTLASQPERQAAAGQDEYGRASTTSEVPARATPTAAPVAENAQPEAKLKPGAPQAAHNSAVRL